MICETDGCENEVPPRDLGTSGRPRKHCRVCRPERTKETVAAERARRLDDHRERNQAIIQERSHTRCALCDRPVVVLGDYICSICAGREARSEARKKALDAVTRKHGLVQTR
jgi:hypothetical protein